MVEALAAQGAERGRHARKQVPRSSHAAWRGRPSELAVELVAESNQDRLGELVPIRVERMRSSPFAFLRGSPGVMAHDLAATPVSGITVQASGDAHLMNFGLFATPERNLVFGLNDFDETHPAPWEWDLKRLVISLVVAGRTVGFDTVVCDEAAREAVRLYRERIAEYARMRLLDVWYTRVDAAEVLRTAGDPRRQREVRRRIARAEHHTNLDALPKLTERVDGRWCFLESPPLLSHVDECDEEWLAGVLRRYRSSLQDNVRLLLDRYEVHDVARKVVGVGSVGTRCYVVVLITDRADDPLFLQIKQAATSVLEPYTGRTRFRHAGRRVVHGQRLLQTASDIFLGWTPDGTRDFYIRQLWDMKGSIDLDAMASSDLAPYGRLCGWVLARGAAATLPPSAATWAPATGSTRPSPHLLTRTPTRPKPTSMPSNEYTVGPNPLRQACGTA